MKPLSDKAAQLPPAIVLSLYEIGLGIARSLGRRGTEVIGIVSKRDAPGNASRYCKVEYGPDLRDAPDACADYLLAVAGRLGRRAILFPTSDADLLFLDRYREALSESFVLAIPPCEPLHLLMEKGQLAAFAESCGVDSPITRRIGSLHELDAVSDELVYPAVLKPVYANDWRAPHVWKAVGRRKAIKVDTHEACRDTYGRLASVVPHALVQEWIPGSDDGCFVLGIVMGSSKVPLAAFTARKLVQYPPGFGIGCLVRAEEHREVYERGLKLLNAAGYRGVAEVEFKRDSRTGEYRLVEVNPRHWDQHALGHTVGQDITWASYCDMLDLPQVRSEAARYGAAWVGGRGLQGAIKEAIRTGKVGTVVGLTASVLSARCFAMWAPDDQGPFWSSVRTNWQWRKTAAAPGLSEESAA